MFLFLLLDHFSNYLLSTVQLFHIHSNSRYNSNQKSNNKMCRGNLQYFGDCGHEKKFHPTKLCPYYSPNQDKCLGTLTICHQTVVHSPAICVSCAVRIETGMILECDRATRKFEKKIETLNRALSKEKDTRVHRAMISERAKLMKALAEFTERKNEELAVFQKEQGRNAPGRAEDLPHDWWNDEEEDSVQASRSRHGWCDDDDEDTSRLVAPFDDQWNDDLLQARKIPCE